MGAIAGRLFAAVKEGRLASGLKRRLKLAAHRLARVVVQRPALRRTALAGSVLVPWLKPRLRALLSGASAAPSPTSLSPSAQLVYRRLQRAQHHHKSS